MAASTRVVFPSHCCMYSGKEGTRHYSKTATLLKKIIEDITPAVGEAIGKMLFNI